VEDFGTWNSGSVRFHYRTTFGISIFMVSACSGAKKFMPSICNASLLVQLGVFIRGSIRAIVSACEYSSGVYKL